MRRRNHHHRHHALHDEAERFDRLAFLSRGRLTAVGTPTEVKRTFGDDLSLEDIFVQLQQRES